MKTIAYFSGAHFGNDPAYAEAARVVGDCVGSFRCVTKFGGSRRGLMGVYCRAVQNAANRTESGTVILGYVPRKFLEINAPETLGIPFTVTETLSERKHLLLEGADACIVMPGGVGTLDEIYETIEQDYVPGDGNAESLGQPIRPLFILNLNGYYGPTRDQLARMEREGFLIPQKIETLRFYDTPADLVAALEDFLRNP